MTDPPFDPSSLPTKRVGAGALVRNAAGQMLLVKPTYKPMWEIPGGLVESGESPHEAVRRECLEELGQPIDIGDLLCVHYTASARLPGDGVMFVFDGGTTDMQAGHFVLPADELAAAAFVPPADLATHLPAAVVRRMLAAVEAAGQGRIIYLER